MTPIQPMCSYVLVNQPNLPEATALDTLPRLAPVALTPLVIALVMVDHNDTEAAETTASAAIPTISPRRIGSLARLRKRMPAWTSTTTARGGVTSRVSESRSTASTAQP